MALLGAQFVNAVSPNPVGSLQAYAGASAPTGWLLCDGTSYTTAAYPELYSVLGYTYGGSGSNFSVPDLRGRVLVGKGTHVDVDALGDNDGSSLANRRPKHQHTLYDPTHKHDAYGTIDNINVGAGGTGYARNLFAYNLPTTYSATGVKVNPEGAASSSSPQDGPAYLVTNYIIKAVADAPRSGLAYGSTPPIVTALPANPQFGDVVTYIADAANGVAWNLQYDASGTYPWKFIGGAPLYASTTGTTASYSGTSFALAASGNLSASLPLAGDYWTSLTLLGTNGTAGAWWMAGLSGPGSSATDQQAARAIQHATGNWWSNGAVSCPRTFTAPGTVEVQYRVTSGAAQFAERGFSLTPVRVKAA